MDLFDEFIPRLFVCCPQQPTALLLVSPIVRLRDRAKLDLSLLIFFISEYKKKSINSSSNIRFYYVVVETPPRSVTSIVM